MVKQTITPLARLGNALRPKYMAVLNWASYWPLRLCWLGCAMALWRLTCWVNFFGDAPTCFDGFDRQARLRDGLFFLKGSNTKSTDIARGPIMPISSVLAEMGLSGTR
jgi:hypothetical protein